MKFTKEDAYKDLVGKLTAKGEALNLSERTAKRFLETLMKKLANDETELSDFMKDVYDDFKELDGNYRKDNSDFIKKWNEEHQPSTTPPVTPTVKTEGEKTDLEKRLEAMEKELESKKKSEIISGIRNNLLATMKSKGITDEEWAKEFISEINITEDFDVEAKAESYLKIFNKSNATVTPNVTPHGSSGGDASKSEFAAIKAFREKKLKEQGLLKD